MKKEQKEEDIYLTTELKPVSIPKRIVRGFVKPLVIILVLGVILFLIGYFLLYPLYRKYLYRDPKGVFESTIECIDEFLRDNSLSKGYVIDYDIESNIESLVSSNSINYVINGNNKDLIIKSKDYNLGYLMRDKNYLYVDNTIYDVSEVDEDIFDSLNDLLNGEYDSLGDKLNKYLTEDRLSYNKENIKVYYDEIEVIRNSLKLSYKDINEILGINLKKGEAIINIYTKDSNFVGIDFEYNGFTEFYCYQYNNYLDLYLNLDRITNAGDTIKVLGIYEDKWNLSIKYNGGEIGVITVNTLEEKKIDFDYKIHIVTFNAKGNVFIERNDKLDKAVVSFASGDNNIKVNINGKYTEGNLLDISGLTVKPYSKEIINEQLSKYGILDCMTLEDEGEVNG